MQLAIAFIIAAGVLIFVFTRLQRARNEQLSPKEEPKERKSRRERKLEKIREYDPLPEPKSIFDIMNEEADELGINAIPGGEGLEVPVKLKVWRRDEGIREACGESVRYEITAGVEPETATVDDVWLVCADGTKPVIAAPPQTADDVPAAEEAPAEETPAEEPSAGEPAAEGDAEADDQESDQDRDGADAHSG